LEYRSLISVEENLDSGYDYAQQYTFFKKTFGYMRLVTHAYYLSISETDVIA